MATVDSCDNDDVMLMNEFRIARGRLVEALRDPSGSQWQLLSTLLHESRDTVIGRTHDFASIRSLADYQKRVPVCEYDDIAPYVQRMLAGEPDVLIPGRPLFCAQTSGSSGRPKQILFPDNVRGEYIALLGPMFASMADDLPGFARYAVTLSGKYLEGQSPGGIPVGSASGLVRNLFPDWPPFAALPECVFESTTYDARYYTMLYLLLQRPLRAIQALNPSTIITLFKKAAEFAEPLADDIAHGRLVAGPAGTATIADQIRASSGQLPARNPALAERLRASVRTHRRFVPADVWPDLAMFSTWKGGSARHYLRQLTDYCPQASIWPMQCSATEGGFATPLCQHWVGGLPSFTASVLEFIEAGNDPAGADIIDVVDIRDLRPGQRYQLVLTNSRGLYRHAVDDVFCVEGFSDGVPIIYYSHRATATSSLTGEKLTEADVAAAVGAGDAPVSVIQSFTLAPRWADPPYYQLLVELAEPAPPVDQLKVLLARIDDELQAVNLEYSAKRQSQRLGPMQMAILVTGEFDRMRRERSSDIGRSDAQVKLPHLHTELLDDAGYQIHYTIAMV